MTTGSAGSATSTTTPPSTSSGPCPTWSHRYDHVWGFPLPYMMCVQEAPAAHGAPGGGDWHLHVELLPPHRNPQRLKVRASVETALGVFINDTVPEALAAELRSAEGDHRDWSGVAVRSVETLTDSQTLSIEG